MRRLAEIKRIIRILLRIARRRQAELPCRNGSRPDMDHQLVSAVLQIGKPDFVRKIHVVGVAHQSAVHVDVRNGVDSFKFYVLRAVRITELKFVVIPYMPIFKVLHRQGIKAEKRIPDDIGMIKVKLKISGNARRNLRQLFFFQRSNVPNLIRIFPADIIFLVSDPPAASELQNGFVHKYTP